MGLINIGIGEYSVSSGADDILKTYALGSCVAVMIYDAKLCTAGLIHIALPDSSADIEKAGISPGHFVDTGLPLLIEEMKQNGALKHNIWIKLAGGSNVMDPNYLFDIGKRNVLAIKKYLWKNNLGPVAEDTGGNISRTVKFVVGTGEIILSSSNREWKI